LLLTNSGATLGVPKISRIEGCINDGVAAFINLRDAVNPQFLYFFWSTQTTHLRAWVDLGAQPNLNTQIIGGWPIALPPRLEQDSVVDRITNEAAAVTRTVSRAQKEIDLLREYRTRLIADVVTGKLDVRGVELPPLDDNETSDDIADVEDTADEEMTAIEEDANAGD
jgi:type I restriction enzyme S subunit